MIKIKIFLKLVTISPKFTRFQYKDTNGKKENFRYTQ